MIYRQPPTAAGLPFPRRHLRVCTAILAVTSVLTVITLLVFGLGEYWRETPLGAIMFAAVSAVVAGGVAICGAFALRGKAAPIAALGVLPAVPVVVSAGHSAWSAFAWLDVFRESERGEWRRFAFSAMSGSNALLARGALVSGAAFAVAAMSLLGMTIAIDRGRIGTPSGNAWVLSILFGVMGTGAAIGGPSSAYVVPLLVVVTILSALAARNGAVVRAWHSAAEARRATSSLLAAALAASAAVLLFDLSARFRVENMWLDTITSQGGTDMRAAAIELRQLSTQTWIDGIAAFTIVLPALSAARGTRGHVFGAPSFAALAVWVAIAMLLPAVREWEARSLQRATDSEFPGDLRVVFPGSALPCRALSRHAIVGVRSMQEPMQGCRLKHGTLHTPVDERPRRASFVSRSPA